MMKMKYIFLPMLMVALLLQGCTSRVNEEFRDFNYPIIYKSFGSIWKEENLFAYIILLNDTHSTIVVYEDDNVKVINGKCDDNWDEMFAIDSGDLIYVFLKSDYGLLPMNNSGQITSNGSELDRELYVGQPGDGLGLRRWGYKYVPESEQWMILKETMNYSNGIQQGNAAGTP